MTLTKLRVVALAGALLLLTGVGGSALAQTQVGGPGESPPAKVSLSASPLLEASVNLTDAQILGLHGAPVPVVAAPGPDQRIVVVSWDIALDNAAGLYAGGGAAYLTLAGVQVSDINHVSFFTTDAAASKLAASGPPNNGGGKAAMTNQPLMITNVTANFAGGNAANKATVHVVYLVRSTLPEG